MPYTDSNESIYYSVLIDEFLRIGRSSHLYKDFNEKAMELLNRMKAQGAQSLRCRKVLSKSFKDTKQHLRILDKIYYLTHDTLSAALSFCDIYF